MALRRTAAPAAEPVSLAEAKLHMGVTVSEHDALIEAFIKAARIQAEHRCQRSFVDQEWTLTLDAFPEAIRLPMPRVTAITAASYVDAGGVTQTLAGADYYLDNASEYANWMVPAYGGAWPSVRDQANGLTVVYRAGAVDVAAVPEDVKVWIRMLVGQWYEFREAGVEKAVSVQPSPFWDGLIDGYRVMGV